MVIMESFSSSSSSTFSTLINDHVGQREREEEEEERGNIKFIFNCPSLDCCYQEGEGESVHLNHGQDEDQQQ